MESYTKEQRDRCARFGDVTSNGVVFDWWLVGPDGASFCLIREPHHTDDDIREAKRYLMRQRDVVGRIRVSRIIGE